MQCVVACGAAVPWAMQVGLKRGHVGWGLSRRSALAAAREFVQVRKHKTTSPDRFSFLKLEAASWVIVHYKSERVEASDIPALVAYYKPQIEAYAKVREKAARQSVVESGLLFTHTGEYVV